MKRFVHFDECKRFLLLECKSKLGQQRPQQSRYEQDLLERGRKWEERVCSQLDRLYSFDKKSLCDSFAQMRCFAESRRCGEQCYIRGARFALGKAEVDLIAFRVASNGILTILELIDIKASERVKPEHTAQLAFYALAVRQAAKANRLVVNLEFMRGAVWARGDDDEVLREVFDLSLAEAWLHNTVAPALQSVCAGQDNQWHFNAACQGCPHRILCKKQTLEARLIAFPYQSTAEYVQLTTEIGSNMLEDLKHRSALVDKSMIDAFESGHVLPSRNVSYECSVQEDVRLWPLALLFDPDRMLVAWSLGSWKQGSDLVSLVDEMTRLVANLHAGEKYQFLVYDSVERERLRTALSRHEKYELQFRMWFPREEEALLQPVQANLHSRGQWDLGCPRIGVVHKLLKTVLCFPVPGWFDFDDAVNQLLPEASAAAEALTLNDIYEMWSIDKDSAMYLLEFRSQLVLQLRGKAIQLNRRNILGVVHGMQADCHRFTPILSRVRFVKQLEAVLACASLRTSRALRKGDVIEIELQEVREINKLFLLQCHVSSGSEFLPVVTSDAHAAKHGLRLFDWIATDASVERHFEVFFEDFEFHTLIDASRLGRAVGQRFNDELVIANVDHVNQRMVHLCIGFRKPSWLTRGVRLQLRNRYVDLNVVKWNKVFERLSEHGEFVRLVQHPVAFFRERLPTPAIGSSDKANQIPLEGSQLAVYENLRKTRLTILWGPPGAGKTYCISACLMRCLLASKEKLHILVTAFTHAALSSFESQYDRRVQECEERVDGFVAPEFVDLSTLKTFQDVQKTMLRSGKCIFVGTLWAIAKVAYHHQNHISFDMVVIDEASQMLVSDAAIALECVKRTGRVLIAGDHLQLQPLLQTAYPKPKDLREPELATGIMQCLLRNDSNLRVDFRRHGVDLQQEVPYLLALKEQRRMCQQLSNATQPLYGFQFDLKSSATKLVHPLRSEMVSDARMTYEEELEQQAKLVMRLVHNLLEELGHNHDGVFVITPHRAQRSRFSQQLEGLPKVQVDTVDRMQGKECAAAILCYSFLDLQRVENEMDFIFDLPRINVALSRAKACTVLVVSRAVMEPPLAVLTTEARRAAFAHLRDFYGKSFQREEMDTSE